MLYHRPSRKDLRPNTWEASTPNDAMPGHVKFLIRHALIGFSIGLFTVALIVSQDLGHIGTLIKSSNDRWLALGLLCFLFGLTFGSLQMGFAIMLLPEEDD